MKETMKVERRPARLKKCLTPEQHEALAEALEMDLDEVDPENSTEALHTAFRERRGDPHQAIIILVDAGVLVAVQPA